MMSNFLIIQRFDGEKWVDYSCHYFYTSFEKVLRQYAYFKWKHPSELFRIAKGKEDISDFFDSTNAT